MLDPRAILLCAILTLAGPLASAAAAPEQEPPERRGETTLRVGTATRPDSLNPLVDNNRLGRALMTVLYDELLPIDADGQPLPALIHKWTRSNDGRLWLLDIRPGLRWSDGTPVTARDVVHTLKRIQNSPRSRFSGWLEGVASIDRFARLRVGIQLKKPAATPPPLPIPVLPRHVWKSVQAEDVNSFANSPPVGSGAFTTETTEGETLVLKSRKRHWRDDAEIDTIELRFFGSQTDLVTALETGDIDVADDVDPDLVPRLEPQPAIGVHTTPATAFVSLGMNTGATGGNGSVVLRQVRVRRAIAHALDRDALRQAVLGSYGQTGSTIVPPSLPDHAEPAPGSELAFDRERSDALLDRAELHDHDGDGIRELRAGTPFALRLYTRLASPETERLGELISTALGEIGITVTVTALTDRELSDRIRRGRYDLFIWGWEAGTDPSFIVSVLTCAETGPGGLSDTYFCDPDYEDLHQLLAAATGDSRRSRLLRDLQQRAYDRAPYVVLYYRPTFQAFRADRFTAPLDENASLVFASEPGGPVNLELLAGETPDASVRTQSEATPASAAPTNDLVEEIRSSLLWQLLAAAVLVTLALLLLPRVVRGLLRLRRSRRARKDERLGESEPDEPKPGEQESDGSEPDASESDAVVGEDTGEIPSQAAPPANDEAGK